MARPKEVRYVLQLAYVLAKGSEISVSLRIPGVLAIVAGILILIFPKLLNYIVAGYLIFVGVVQIFKHPILRASPNPPAYRRTNAASPSSSVTRRRR